MTPSKKLVLSLALVSTLSACSKVQDMHNATLQMNGKTSSLATTSESMKGVMGEIYDSGRQGAALDLRTKQFEMLLSSKKLEDKALYAGLYFLAFEFQLWSNVGIDDQKGERERLMKDAADEFVRRIVGIAHWDGVDPFAGKNPLAFGEAENERASFNALAAALERNNRKQEATAEKTGTETVSMLQMIENALRAGKEIKDGRARLSDYPEYVDIILLREELAGRLLEARYQTLGLIVLGQLTPITKNKVEGFKYKIWGKQWDLDLSSVNQSTLRMATFRLQEAQHAKEVLAELGREVTLDPSIQKIYRNARVKNAASAEGKAAVSAEAAQVEADFLEAAAAYIGEDLK